MMKTRKTLRLLDGRKSRFPVGSRKIRLLLAGWLIFVPFCGAFAWDGFVELEAGGGVSDNVTRVSTNENEEAIGTLGTSFDLSEARRNISAYIRGDLRYINYMGDAYDDEIIGGVDSLARINIVDERFSWEVGDFFGQRAVDPFSPITEANRENVNYFTTGPNFELPIGARNFLFADGRWSDIRYEERSDFDNQRLSARLGARHMLSESSSLALTLQGTSVDYNDSTTEGIQPRTDFTRQEAYLTWDKTTGRGGWTVDLGYTEAEIDGRNPDTGETIPVTGSGELYRVSWRHEISAISMFSLSAGSSYSDQGNIFRDDSIGSVDPSLPDSSLPTSDPFRHDYVDIGYLARGRLTSLEVTAVGSREDYESGTGLNNDVFRVQVFASRDIGQVWRLSGEALAYLREYDSGRKDGDLRLGLRLSRTFGKYWAANMRYYRTSRDSTAADADYTENMLFFTLTYELFRRGESLNSFDRASFSRGSY